MHCSFTSVQKYFLKCLFKGRNLYEPNIRKLRYINSLWNRQMLAGRRFSKRLYDANPWFDSYNCDIFILWPDCETYVYILFNCRCLLLLFCIALWFLNCKRVCLKRSRWPGFFNSLYSFSSGHSKRVMFLLTSDDCHL